MPAHRCPRKFLILAEGGVKAIYACGAEVTDKDETAVDVEILADRFPRAHHHHHLRRRHH